MSKPVIRRGLVPAAVLAFLTASAAVTQEFPQKDPKSIRVTFVNVGAGSCTVVECGPDQLGNVAPPILYDCGSSGRGDTGLDRNNAVELVRKILSRYPKPPQVVVSHPDADHYNYIPQIMQNKVATAVLLGGERAEYPVIFRKWLLEQEAQRVPIEAPPPRSDNQKNPINGFCGKTTLLTTSAGDTRNAQSLVLRIQYGDFSATLTGDATEETLRSIEANWRNSNLQTLLLSAPHHGASTDGSNDINWNRVFRPDIVVYSAGLKYTHPRCEALENYRASLATIVGPASHPLQCGTQGAYMPETSTKAEYLTRSNGTISISSRASLNFEVECFPISNCSLQPQAAPVLPD